ncbi:MAG: translation initiation factor IF-2 [Lachnospiraceae bacterium]|nr:translation initiation factor IF-2 [Lachnospiraceae bacterium]
MASIKLGDLCKEIEASYKEMMTYLRERGCDVRSAGSYVDDEDPEVKIAITLYGKKKRRPAERKEEEKRARGRYDDKGNRVVKKDGVIYSIDKGGNYTAYNGPLYDENHNRLEPKKSLFDADKNPIVRKGNEFYRKDQNGDLVLYDGPIFNEEGRRMKRPTRENAADNGTAAVKTPAAETPVVAEKPAETAQTASEKETVKPSANAETESVDTAAMPAQTAAPVQQAAPVQPATPAQTSAPVRREPVRTSDDRRPDTRRDASQAGAGPRRPREGQGTGYGDRRPSDGTRTTYNRDGQGQGGYRRPVGAGQGSYGDRAGRPGTGYGDRRPADGTRTPYNRDGQGANRRPAGAGAGAGRGFSQGGFGGGGFDKDKDAGDRKPFQQRRNDNRSGQGSSIKSDFASEINRGKNAAAYQNRDRDKNRNNRDFDDGKKTGKKGQTPKKDANRKGAFIMPKVEPKREEDPNEIKNITIPEVITIKELADKMKQNASAIIKKLFLAGKLYNINSEISFEEAEEIALDYNYIVEKEEVVDMVEVLTRDTEDAEETLEKRPPVVCVMGHVDHGKTSILDAIRSAHVAAKEAGGITQHIGAYMVEKNGRKITFLDTPGHEAFTAMRLRGAIATDIAVLVVAADDGVMPQTIEAINHAKAAGVAIVVAINKMDKEGANPDRVLTELSEQGLVSEEWGGDIVTCRVSAKTGEGIENLLEMILLSADVLELQANPNRRARGLVIEAKLDKGRGPVATVLVQKGTLHVGETVSIGAAYGKIRAMINDQGQKVTEATPSTPVEILGLNSVPNAGDLMIVTENEKEAKNISDAHIAQSKEKLIAETKQKLSLESLHDAVAAGEMKDLNIIVKADVAGSVEAVKQSLLKLSNEEIAVHCIHGGVGNINESDVTLASASNAIIIGFNVKPDNTAKETAEREKVDVRLYSVIYNAIDDIEAAMKGMLDPVYEEVVIGHAEIRMIFKASGLGSIAGSYILDGKAQRGCKARITRGGTQIFDGNLASLKRMKDDAKEVAAGYECGILFEKFNDIAEGDQVELYVMQQVARN